MMHQIANIQAKMSNKCTMRHENVNLFNPVKKAKAVRSSTTVNDHFQSPFPIVRDKK